MLKLISPAKINLFLRIIRRRPDGYHDLASLFQAVSLHDTIDFSLSDKDELTCNKPQIPTDNTNLILKAAHLFRRKTGLQFGLKAHLVKRIPHEAGLGGGSSNAATTLWALNELHHQPATLDELIAWSGEIGSDITFFLSQGTAFCTGRGEIMQSLGPLPMQNLWIAKPQEGLSTPAVFKSLDLSSIAQRDPQGVLESFYQGKCEYFNDLEETAFCLQPNLKSIKMKLLESGFEKVIMTGSGTAFFCIGMCNQKPLIEGVEFHPVNFIRRQAHQWFSANFNESENLKT